MNGPIWKVVTTTPSSGRDQSGTLAPGWNVTYQLDTGAQGTVFIPKTLPDADAMRALINADAVMLAVVSSLTSG